MTQLPDRKLGDVCKLVAMTHGEHGECRKTSETQTIETVIQKLVSTGAYKKYVKKGLRQDMMAVWPPLPAR